MIQVKIPCLVVLVVVAAFMLFYNIRIKKQSPEDLLVNQMARAAEAAAAAEAPEAEITAAADEAPQEPVSDETTIQEDIHGDDH